MPMMAIRCHCILLTLWFPGPCSYCLWQTLQVGKTGDIMHSNWKRPGATWHTACVPCLQEEGENNEEEENYCKSFFPLCHTFHCVAQLFFMTLFIVLKDDSHHVLCVLVEDIHFYSFYFIFIHSIVHSCHCWICVLQKVIPYVLTSYCLWHILSISLDLDKYCMLMMNILKCNMICMYSKSSDAKERERKYFWFKWVMCNQSCLPLSGLLHVLLAIKHGKKTYHWASHANFSPKSFSYLPISLDFIDFYCLVPLLGDLDLGCGSQGWCKVKPLGFIFLLIFLWARIEFDLVLKQFKLLLLLFLCSPAISLGFTIFGEIFAYVTVFNPTIEVVTFCLRGYVQTECPDTAFAPDYKNQRK